MGTDFVESGRKASADAHAASSSMDRPLAKPRPRLILAAIGALLFLGAFIAYTQLMPRGYRVHRSDIRVATVSEGLFHNDIVVRSTAEPLHTVMLDVLDAGRVEELLVADGALVAQGDVLFRLSNPQLRLSLIAREAERAQQISNLSELRVSIEAGQTDHERRKLELAFLLAQAERQYARNSALIKTGVVSIAAFEDSRDRVEQQRQAVAEETTRHLIEARTKRNAVSQMAQAVRRLDDGLHVVNDLIGALAVRAPIAGRLTDFRLQLGEIVKAEQRVGRIDDPTHYKLSAQIDEYFLGSVLTGREGSAKVGGREYAVKVRRVFPQIKDGRFLAELLFTGDAPPEMNPGQSVDTRITLGEKRRALLLPNESFLGDTGGTWAFVLRPDGRSAERRNIVVGRRNSSQLELSSGLAAGERVIVSTYVRFATAERLRIAN